MTVSVLCPTRLRPHRLEASLESLAQTMRGEVEVLLAADLDDPSDYEDLWFHSLTRVERMGYGRLHEYYNLLAKQAEGDWLLLWNDDCIMLTEGWDMIIESYPQTRVLAPHTHHDPLMVIPIIPRAFTEACGHYAEILHVDTWWVELGNKLGICEWLDVHVDHQRFDKPGHETEPDSVYAERDFQLHTFYSDSMQRLHDRDVEVVRSLIG